MDGPLTASDCTQKRHMAEELQFAARAGEVAREAAEAAAGRADAAAAAQEEAKRSAEDLRSQLDAAKARQASGTQCRALKAEPQLSMLCS